MQLAGQAAQGQAVWAVRVAPAALGHPVDIEKIRQAAIEAAHLEGFNRSPQDVTLRRLISFALSPTLKSSFEQIFSPPIMVEAIFAEVADSPEQDVLVRMHYDGNHHYQTSGVLVAHTDAKREEEAAVWLRQALGPADSLGRAAGACMLAWRTLTEDKPFSDLTVRGDLPLKANGKVAETALLDRKASGSVHYRTLSPAALTS